MTMKTKIIITAIFLFSAIATWALTSNKEKGIAFTEAGWEETLKKAENENRMIFLDIYATWCGPCKRLELFTFSNQQVGDYFNENFINITVDGESEEGRELVRKYGIRGYPSLLIIDHNGEVKKFTTGYHSAKQLLKWARK